MKKIMLFVLIPLCLIVITIIIMILINPFFLRSERQIRSNILKLTPIGMNIEDVVNVARNDTKWETLRQVGWVQLSSLSEDEIQLYINERTKAKLLNLYLGRSLGYNSVTAHWNFDENGKLIDVDVRKELAI